jgi:CRP-like cAMP-binding protein
VGSRVARQLVRLQEQIGRPANGSVEIGLSREDLAQMTGTTLFTVSRLLSAWEARGLVHARRESVTICETESLRKISGEI